MSKMKIVFMRGIPGSGKTPWAIENFGNDPNAVILSSADYFMKDGEYKWVAHLTPNSHTWNLNRFRKAILDGKTTIVVDNTNIKAWDMKPYLSTLKRYPEYQIFQKIMDVDLEDAINGTIHNVPAFSILRMDENFEDVENMEHYA